MITFRKISAEGAGKLIVQYLREHCAEPEFDARCEKEPEGQRHDDGDRMTTYYTGRDGRGVWSPQMGDRIADSLGIDLTQQPSDEALARLFEGKRADNGEKWAGDHAKRTISAIDFTAAPDKSVTLAAELATTETEKALIWHAIHQANDRAMSFIADEVGVARCGKGGMGFT